MNKTENTAAVKGETIDIVLDTLATAAYQNSVNKGFYTDMGENPAEKIALMHSELSEVLEAIRKPEPQMSEKIPEFTEEEDEIADVLIRVFDYVGWRKLRLGGAVRAKMAYNANRPYKHGKKF